MPSQVARKATQESTRRRLQSNLPTPIKTGLDLLAIGERVRNERHRKALSQGQLAARLGLKGKTGVHRIEKGRQRLTIVELVQLAAIFQRPLAWILGISEAVPKKGK
jgi:ribosome-binding protein aMBF1 (putative translation factor)